MNWVNPDCFSPALDSAHIIDVPPNERAGAVAILLRARLGSAAVAAQIVREGIQVQAWTNAPVQGMPDGAWAAYTFAPPPSPPSGPSDADPDAGEPEFALDPPDAESPYSEPHTLVCRLKLRPPPADQPTARFSVTYRLVYSDGGTWWLGSAGHDASCHVRRADPWLVAHDDDRAPAPVDADAEMGADAGDDNMDIFRAVSMKEDWGVWAVAQDR
jgi:hypothetical protein